MDYATALLALAWAKLIIGSGFALTGAFTVIFGTVGWNIGGPHNKLQTAAAGGEIFLGLLITLAGFYIAGW